jgi:hypothetical protein
MTTLTFKIVEACFGKVPSCQWYNKQPIIAHPFKGTWEQFIHVLTFQDPHHK